MPGDFKVVCIKQVFHFNSVHINEVQLQVATIIIATYFSFTIFFKKAVTLCQDV